MGLMKSSLGFKDRAAWTISLVGTAGLALIAADGGEGQGHFWSAILARRPTSI